MAFITNFGTLFGVVPETTGRIFWVAPSATYTIAGNSYSASDNHDGLSPERALLTVNRAWALVSANCGDVIVLLPGAHTTAATITANVAGVTMMGLPRYAGSASRPITSLTISSSADIVTISASNIEIAWIHLIPVTTMDSVACATAGVTGIHVHHCSFDLETAAASTSTKGIAQGTASISASYYHDNVFYCDSAQGNGIDFSSASGGSGANSLVEDCSFIQSAGTWASALRHGPSTDGGRGLLVRNCDFIVSNGTLTVGIAGSATNTEEGVHIHNCYFSDSVTVAVDTHGARGAEIAENYQAGVGATDGGVLITAIT